MTADDDIQLREARKRLAAAEDRLVEVETKVSHQEHLLGILNDVVTQQQERIVRLESRCEVLDQRLRSIGETLPGDDGGDDRPPHY